MVLVSAVSAQAGKFNRVLSIGDAAPEWVELPGVDDQKHSLAEYADAKLLVLVFTCNHCPVATAYQQRLMACQKDFQDRGVQIVAISCSSENTDNLPAMKQRASDEGYNFPYLHDADQRVGRAYGALKTPTVFLLDRSRAIAYMGAIDDHWADADKAGKNYLRDAIEALLAGEKPSTTETRPQGCEIRFKPATRR